MLKALALFFSAIILLIQPAAFAAAAESKPAVSDLLYERAFVQGPFGQVHVLTVQPRAGMILKTPLVLFHPTPYSSDYFKRFIPYMASDRMVIAMDTPAMGIPQSPWNCSQSPVTPRPPWRPFKHYHMGTGALSMFSDTIRAR